MIPLTLNITNIVDRKKSCDIFSLDLSVNFHFQKGLDEHEFVFGHALAPQKHELELFELVQLSRLDLCQNIRQNIIVDIDPRNFIETWISYKWASNKWDPKRARNGRNLV